MTLFCFSNRNKILPTCIFLICHCPWMSKNLKICWNHLDKLFLQGYYVIPVAQVVVLALLGKHAGLVLILWTMIALLHFLENKYWAKIEKWSQDHDRQLHHKLKICVRIGWQFSTSVGCSLVFSNLRTLIFSDSGQGNITWAITFKVHVLNIFINYIKMPISS